MRYLICIILLVFSFSVKAEKGYIDYNKLYFDGVGYNVYDVKGTNNTWYWEERSLKITNESENKTADGENPATEDWIVFGPYNLSLAVDVELEFEMKVLFGSNQTSVLVSNSFPGYDKEIEMPGNWQTVLSNAEIAPTLNNDTTIAVNLSSFDGDKEVYIAFKYESPITIDALNNQITNFSLTRKVDDKVVELKPAINIDRSTKNVDYFNLPGEVGETDAWSVRRGYAVASSSYGENCWLVMRPFNLLTSGDAFFSFESKTGKGTEGPIGLQIKIGKVQFDENTELSSVEWEDYSTGKVDHRSFKTDYFESGKLDLSNYVGNWVTVAFRYFNPNNHDYSIQNFKMFHLPDVIPPQLTNFEMSRLVYNKVFVDYKVNEAATVYWGIYNSTDAKPNFESLQVGANSVAFGVNDYLYANTDTTYSFPGIVENTKYKLYTALADINGNISTVSELSFETGNKDLIAPDLVDASFSGTNNFSSVFSFKTTKPCTYYYLVQKSTDDKPASDAIKTNGKFAYIENEEHKLGFYNFEKNTSYTIYWLGVDYADNQSSIMERSVTTTNFDLDPPVVVKAEISDVNDFEVQFTISADEAGTAYYAVQTVDQEAPTVELIKQGVNAVTFGTFNYSTANTEITQIANELQGNTDYILFITVIDNVNNASQIKAIQFKTTSLLVPIIEATSKERLIIDREETFKITADMITVTNGADMAGYGVKVLKGENYSYSNDSFTAADNFTGAIKVPVCLQKNKSATNIVEFNFIVDYQTVQDSLAGLRRVMRGDRLSNPIEDLSTSYALLDLLPDGSFFGGEQSKSPDYLEYMNTVLGGRMINISKDYYDEKFRIRKALEVRTRMYKAISYWIDNKPVYSYPEAPLYWPEYLGAIMLTIYDDMMYDYKSSPSKREEIDNLIQKVDDFNQWCWAAPDSVFIFQPYKGNNISERVWGATALAAVTGNVEMVYEIYDTLVSSISYQYNSEIYHPAGLMPDGSYCMNNKSGSQWNWYGYGLNWLDDVISYAEVTKRTNWRLPKENFNQLAGAVSDGLEWLHWNDFIPHNLTGKYYSQRGNRRMKGSVLSFMNRIRYNGFVNNADLVDNEKIFENYEKVKSDMYTRDSTKYFWNANAVIHSRKSYISTVITPSARTGGFETGIDTIYGLQSFFLGDGAIFTYNDLSSYANRYLLDQANLPGVTREKRNVVWTYNFEGQNGASLNEFAGGTSNGKNAISTFYYDKKDNKANVRGFKSYFFFNEGYVALGNSFNKKTNNAVYPVSTFIEQELFESAIKYNVQGDQIQSMAPSLTEKNQNFTLKNPGWFRISGKTYYVFADNDDPAKLSLNIKERTESWDVFNGEERNYVDNVDYEPTYETAMVATLEFDHGKDLNDANYAYMAIGAKNEDKIVDYFKSKPVSILANTNKVQAVYFNEENLFGIVFIEAGTLKLSEELEIMVDKPATLLVKQNDTGIIEIWASDPYQKENMLEVTLLKSEKERLPETIQRLMIFPNGIYKGKTVYTNTDDNLALLNNDTSSETEVETSVDEDVKDEFNLKTYPVPVSNGEFLNVEFTCNETKDVKIRVINTMGQSLYLKESKMFNGKMKMQIDCNNFSKGVHLLILQTNNNLVQRPFIVQ